MALPIKLTLEIVTPDRALVNEQVDEVELPGSEGYFGVLPGHIPFITTLDIGELTYWKGKDERHLAVTWGYAEVRGDKVIILAEMAERAEEIDMERAQRARDRAETRLRQWAAGDETIDFVRAQGALYRAMTRLEVASRGR